MNAVRTAAPTGRGSIDDIPGPRGNWLLGSARDLRDDLLGLLTRGMHDYGDVVRYRAGIVGTPLQATLVVAHHPDDVQKVLTQTERTLTKDTRIFRALAEMLGRGLLTSVGEDWRRQRRIVQPLFTPHRVAGYLDLMGEEARKVAADAPADGRAVDVHLLMLRYTLRVVGRALFGDDIDDMVGILDRLVPEASTIARRRMSRVVQAPLTWRLPTNRRARQLRAEQYAIVDEILARSLAASGGSGPDESRDDLVTRLRLAKDPDTGERIAEREIRDQALIFLMAGHETTAGALTFTLHLLGRHLDVQDVVAAEVREILGTDPDAPVTSEQIGRLAWTRAALREGMRLYPSAHATDRVTTAPLTLGGYDLPAGSQVLVSPWATHRHPDFWPDPERFDPSRFLGESDRPRYAYFPFGGGPRSCVGEHFALLEAVTVLAVLLRSRRVASVRGDMAVYPGITLRPVGEVPVVFETR